MTAVGFVTAGMAHFLFPGFFVRIVPPALPQPELLVAVSGIAEILGGTGLLFSRLRSWAGWGLITLLLAVFPANIHMAIDSERYSDLGYPPWVYWARLPLQLVFIAVVWKVSRADNR